MVPAAFVCARSAAAHAQRQGGPAGAAGAGTRAAGPGGGLRRPAHPRRASLADIWAQVLRLERVGVEDNFFELGGDSIISLQMVSRARASAGCACTPRHCSSTRRSRAWPRLAGGRQAAAQAEQGPVTGPVPLTPIQHWFFEQDLAEPHHYNQALLLRSAAPPGPRAAWSGRSAPAGAPRRPAAALHAHGVGLAAGQCREAGGAR